MIIGIVNQKGGTGKTTLAINLADCLARKHQQVLLVDADPQGSVVSWDSVRHDAKFRIRSVDDARIVDLVHEDRRVYDHIIIDAPPSVAPTAEAILEASELVIVPIGPSPLDIWSSKEIVALIRVAVAKRPNLKVKLLICKTIVGTRLSNEARETLNGFGLELFDTQVCQRVAYIEALIAGQSVLGYAPRSAAAAELMGLCGEII